MKPYVVIDIETVENSRAKELYSKKTYEPAANLRDPVKIQQSILEKRQKDMDKCALHWWTGKVICICANVLGTGIAEKPRTFIGDNEKELLCQFLDWADGLYKRHNGFQLIAKSGEYFDKPFLIGRLLALDLGLPYYLRPDRGITDIDHIFSWSSQCDQRTSLEHYAFGLGIGGKTGHGSDVAGLYNLTVLGDGDAWAKIGAYCANDTDIATVILQRYLKAYEPTVQEIPQPMSADEIPFG